MDLSREGAEVLFCKKSPIGMVVKDVLRWIP